MLFERALGYKEKYFKDLSLERFGKELTSCQVLEGGKWVKECDGFSQDFDLSLDNWRFLIADNLGYAAGECNGLEKTIRIVEKCKGGKIILLHEMIHAFESMLAEECELYKQFLILKLYKKLETQIPNLMDLVMTDCHRAFMVHTVFFLLKSLDLDLRLKKPLGTIYSYGRTKLFK